MVYLNQSEHERKKNIENFPDDYPISDAMLSTCLHFSKVLRIKTIGILLPGISFSQSLTFYFVNGAGYQLPNVEALPSFEEANAKYASGIHDLISLPMLKTFKFERSAWHDYTPNAGMFYT